MIFRKKPNLENKIFVYKNEFGESEVIAVSKKYNKTSNTSLAVQYPIGFNSRIFLLTLREEQKKKELSFLEKAGDWYCLKEASKNEKEELKRIASSKHLFSDTE